MKMREWYVQGMSDDELLYNTVFPDIQIVIHYVRQRRISRYTYGMKNIVKICILIYWDELVTLACSINMQIFTTSIHHMIFILHSTQLPQIHVGPAQFLISFINSSGLSKSIFSLMKIGRSFQILEASDMKVFFHGLS